MEIRGADMSASTSEFPYVVDSDGRLWLVIAASASYFQHFLVDYYGR